MLLFFVVYDPVHAVYLAYIQHVSKDRDKMLTYGTEPCMCLSMMRMGKRPVAVVASKQYFKTLLVDR